MTPGLALCRGWTLVLLALFAVKGLSRAADVDPRAAHVAALYQRYAWELLGWEGPTRPLAAQSRRELARWFTDELAGAIASEQRCVERRREVCSLDFALLWGSQDPDVTHVQVRSLDATTVRILLKPSPSNARAESLQVDARMQKTPHGWRIADLVYGASAQSLKRLLTAPLPP